MRALILFRFDFFTIVFFGGREIQIPLRLFEHRVADVEKVSRGQILTQATALTYYITERDCQ